MGPNPNPGWSKKILEETESGLRKRVRLWDDQEEMIKEMGAGGDVGDQKEADGKVHVSAERRKKDGGATTTAAQSKGKTGAADTPAVGPAAPNTAIRLTNTATNTAVSTAALEAAWPLPAVLEAADPTAEVKAAPSTACTKRSNSMAATSSATNLAAPKPADRLTNAVTSAAVQTAALGTAWPLTAGMGAAGSGAEAGAATGRAACLPAMTPAADSNAGRLTQVATTAAKIIAAVRATVPLPSRPESSRECCRDDSSSREGGQHAPQHWGQQQPAMQIGRPLQHP